MLPLCSWSSTELPRFRRNTIGHFLSKCRLGQKNFIASAASSSFCFEVWLGCRRGCCLEMFMRALLEITIFHDGKLSQGIPLLFHQPVESSLAMQNAHSAGVGTNLPKLQPEIPSRNHFWMKKLIPPTTPCHTGLMDLLCFPFPFPAKKSCQTFSVFTGSWASETPD